MKLFNITIDNIIIIAYIHIEGVRHTYNWGNVTIVTAMVTITYSWDNITSSNNKVMILMNNIFMYKSYINISYINIYIYRI